MKNSIIQDNMVRSNRILYTPGAFAKNNLLHLQETGTLLARKTHTSQRKNLASYLFFIVKSGSGSLEYNNRTYLLSKGDCVFLDCKQKYSHKTSKDLWTLQWVHFYGPNMSEIYREYMEQTEAPVFHPTYPGLFESVLQELFHIAQYDIQHRDMLIYEKLASLLSLIMRESKTKEPSSAGSSKHQRLQSIKQFLDEHYTEKLSLDLLSQTFYINKHHLTRSFREQFGTTVNHYLQNVRITHAKHLLRFSDKTIEEVGADCGMDDPNYFARLFKKVEGMTPGEFRKSWKSEK